MKRNLIVLSLAGLLTSSLATLAQTDAPAADKQPAAASTAPATTSAPADAAATPVATPAPADATPAATTAQVVTPPPAPPATPEAPAAPASGNAARDPNAVIPLI